MLAPEPKSAVCWGRYEGEKGLSAVAGVSVGRSLEGRKQGGGKLWIKAILSNRLKAKLSSLGLLSERGSVPAAPKEQRQINGG